MPPLPADTLTSAGTNARAAEQLYVTHCSYGEGVSGQAGFGVRASSTTDPLLLRCAVEHPSYEIPIGLAVGKRGEGAPRRLALVRVPGGRSALVHTVYLPDEGGRANNFFSHVLIHATLEPREALGCWASADWVTGLPAGAATELPSFPGLPRPGPLDEEAVTMFLQPTANADNDDLETLMSPPRLAGDPDRRRQLLALALRGCLLVLQSSPAAPRGRFYLLAEPGLTALLLYAVARLLPRSLTAGLTFSTYENAHRDLRAYRQAQIVGTCLADPSRGLEDVFFNSRGYALDTYSLRASPELRGGEAPVEEWVDLAARGDWTSVDKAHRLLGEKAGTLTSFQDAVRAARVSRRLTTGEASAQDLLALRKSTWGAQLLERFRGEVWPRVRDLAPAEPRLRTAFAELLKENLPELEELVRQELKSDPLNGWQPRWRLIWSLLEDDPAQLRESFRRILPDPPESSDARFALVREMHDLGLSPIDQRLPLQRLLMRSGPADLERLADSDLPQTWLVWALFAALMRAETRAEAVQRLEAASDELIRVFWDQLRLIKDEFQQRALLVPFVSPGPSGAQFLLQILDAESRVRPGLMEWILDALKVQGSAWVEFWCREDRLTRLAETLHDSSEEAAGVWQRVCALLTPDVLLPGAPQQGALLTALAALAARPAGGLPHSVAQTVADWVLLREHFEKASPLLEVPQGDLLDACKRLGLNPSALLARYFERFVDPQTSAPSPAEKKGTEEGVNEDVLKDFAGFFHTFFPEGDYHAHGARMVGWLEVVASCPSEERRLAYHKFYLEHLVPAQHRQRLSEEMQQAGHLPCPDAPSAECPPVPVVEVSVGPTCPIGPAPTAPGEPAARFALAGVPASAGCRHAPLLALGSQFLWLCLALGGGLAVVVLCGSSLPLVKKLPELALFVPLVVVAAEAMAAQAVAVALEGASTARAAKKLRLFGLRLLTRLPLALVCGAAAGGLALAFWTGPARFTQVLGGAVAGGMVVASVLGLALPGLVRRFGWEARVPAGPVARALASVAAVVLYFRLAGWLLR
jgi:magnesium transporter